MGQNPGTNHPRMLSALERAKAGGARIVAINPLPEAGLVRFRNPQTPRGMLGRGTPMADRFLQVRVNGDLALFRALNRLLLDAERERPGTVLDHAFIDDHTDGFEALQTELAAIDLDATAAAAGVRRTEIEELARLACESERTIVCWAMGLTQHRNSVATIREVVNFLLLRGNIGRPGAGVCPVRGHSNVQGDRTMGISRTPVRGVPRTRSPPSSASSPPAGPVSTSSTRSGPCATGAPASCSRWAATSCPPRPTPR